MSAPATGLLLSAWMKCAEDRESAPSVHHSHARSHSVSHDATDLD